MRVLQNDFSHIKARKLDILEPNRLTVKEVEFILDNERLIRKWLDNIKEYALIAAKNGQKFKGKKLVRALGNRAYTNKIRVKRKLKQNNIAIEKVSTKPELISPAQLEKYLVAIEKWTRKDAQQFVNQITTKPDRGIHLVPLSDNREEIVNEAQDDFKDIPEITETKKLKIKKVNRDASKSR